MYMYTMQKYILGYRRLEYDVQQWFGFVKYKKRNKTKELHFY